MKNVYVGRDVCGIKILTNQEYPSVGADMGQSVAMHPNIKAAHRRRLLQPMELVRCTSLEDGFN